MRFLFAAAAILLGAIACSTEPSPQPQPNEMEQVVNTTRYDPGVVPGALDGEGGNVGDNVSANGTAPTENTGGNSTGE